MTTEPDTTAVATQAAAPKPVQWEESGLPRETVGLARALFASGMFKNVENVAAAIVKVKMGEQLGITAIEAMQYLHVWSDSKRTSIQLGYPLVAALILRSGRYRYEVTTPINDTANVCEIDFWRIRRDGSEYKLGTSRFTWEKAVANGLTGNAVWKQYPDVMLFARAITQGARKFTPDVLGGAGVTTGEEPYIESTAREVMPSDGTDVPTRATSADVIAGASAAVNDEAPAGQEPEPITIDEPPEGFKDPWSRFWVKIKEWGRDKAWVHDLYGIPVKDGALAHAVKLKAVAESKTVAQVVADMLNDIEVTWKAEQAVVRPSATGLPDERTGVATSVTYESAPEDAGETPALGVNPDIVAAAEAEEEILEGERVNIAANYKPTPALDPGEHTGKLAKETPAEYDARVRAKAQAVVAKRRGPTLVDKARQAADRAEKMEAARVLADAANAADEKRYLEVINGEEVEVSEGELRLAYGVDDGDA